MHNGKLNVTVSLPNVSYETQRSVIDMFRLEIDEEVD